jgi:hypothetical protein
MPTNIHILPTYIEDNGTIDISYGDQSIDLNCADGSPKKIGRILYDISNPLVPIKKNSENGNTKWFTIITDCSGDFTVVDFDYIAVMDLMVYDCEVCRTYTFCELVNNCNQPEPTQYNFDIEMDWSILLDNSGNPYTVTNQATFEQWLTDGFDSNGERQNNFTNIAITDFVMIGNRIQCNLNADATIFALGSNSIIHADKIGVINSLEKLYLDNNQIITFNPIIALPSSLKELILLSNQIVTFNPSIALPSGLQYLDLSENQMTTAGYAASEAWANAQPSFTTTCDIYFQFNINSAAGTNLETILTGKNCNVIA